MKTFQMQRKLKNASSQDILFESKYHIGKRHQNEKDWRKKNHIHFVFH